jgi:hypothetical protein
MPNEVYDASDIDNILQMWDGDGLRWRFTIEELRKQIRREEDEELASALRLCMEIMMSYLPKPPPVITPTGEKIDVLTLKARTDIVAVAGRYTELKSGGGRFTGKCPLHESKGRPLTIYPGQQSYHCFHCGKGGDVVNMVMVFQNIDFKAAVGVLNGY